jgi:protein-tyrosine phosphatase
VRGWREDGIEVVVSLLTPEESSELGLREEAEHARGAGLEFHGFPIPDRGVPGSRAATAELVELLGRALAAGRSVALHCRQGIGRSALVAASLLVAAGEEPAAALGTIERVRGVPVPETAAQRRWVEELALEDRHATAAPAIR